MKWQHSSLLDIELSTNLSQQPKAWKRKYLFLKHKTHDITTYSKSFHGFLFSIDQKPNYLTAYARPLGIWSLYFFPLLFPPVLQDASPFLAGMNFHIFVPLSNFTLLFLPIKYLFIL